MRSASLERNGKETGEAILLVPHAEMRLIVAMAEAAVKANPRKPTFKRILKQLEEIACY